MLSRTRLALVLSLALTGGSMAHAQFAVYGMASGGFGSSGTDTTNGVTYRENSFKAGGGTFGVYDDFKRLGPLKLGADARYFEQSASSDYAGITTHIRGGTGGLRLSLKIPLFPLKPYVQAGIGEVSSNYGYLGNNTGSFYYQVGGGVDYTIFPHLDLRFDYGAGPINAPLLLSGDKVTLQQIGLGAVVRF